MSSNTVEGVDGSSLMRTVRCALIAVAVVMALLAPGCARRKAGTTARHVLRYPLRSDPSTLDLWGTTYWETQELLHNVFEPLVTVGANNRIGPCLADRWQVSKDGRVYIFHLAPNAKFHAPFTRTVTAADVK